MSSLIRWDDLLASLQVWGSSSVATPLRARHYSRLNPGNHYEAVSEGNL